MTRNHILEEELVAYHYGEAGVRAELDAHLAECAECRESYAALRGVLAMVSAAEVPEPSADYERRVWQRLEPRLEKPRWWKSLAARPAWLAVPAVAALLLAAFLGGRLTTRPADPTGGSGAAVNQAARERLLMLAVGDHIERSERVLTEVANAPGGRSVNLAAEQQWAGELVSDSRLYRQTARQAGMGGLANQLDELERILLEVARSPEKISAQEFEMLRRRILARDLMFRLRVMRSQAEERARVTPERTRREF